MSRIFFLLNNLEEFNFGHLINRYLNSYYVDIGVSMPNSPPDYKLIILWNYNKIIADLPKQKNVILFHSSDLPKGRGWAPIYYSIFENEPEHYISGIFAEKNVDSGDIIIKASFPLSEDYTADDLRRFDMEISIRMVEMILKRFESREIRGAKQKGLSTYRKRRRSEDNLVDLNQRLIDIIPHLRACEVSSPAFFDLNGTRYNLKLIPQNSAQFPTNIAIAFGEDIT